MKTFCRSMAICFSLVLLMYLTSIPAEAGLRGPKMPPPPDGSFADKFQKGIEKMQQTDEEYQRAKELFPARSQEFANRKMAEKGIGTPGEFEKWRGTNEGTREWLKFLGEKERADKTSRQTAKPTGASRPPGAGDVNDVMNNIQRMKGTKGKSKDGKPPVLRRTETISEEPTRRGGDKEPGRGWVNTPRVSDGDGGIGKASADEPARSRRSFEDDAEARSAGRPDGALNRRSRSLDDEWEKRNVEDVPELQEEVLRETKERDRIKSEEARAEQKAEEGANAEPSEGGDKDKLLEEAGSSETAIDPKTGQPMKGKPGTPKSGASKKLGAAGAKPSTGKPKGGSPSAAGSKGNLSQAQIRAIYAKDKD